MNAINTKWIKLLNHISYSTFHEAVWLYDIKGIKPKKKIRIKIAKKTSRFGDREIFLKDVWNSWELL